MLSLVRSLTVKKVEIEEDKEGFDLIFCMHKQLCHCYVERRKRGSPEGRAEKKGISKNIVIAYSRL